MVFRGIKDNRSLKLWIHIGIWLCFIMVYAIIFGRVLSVELSLLRGLVNVLPMMLIFYANLHLVNRYLERRRYLPFFLANLFLLAVTVALRVRLNLMFPDVSRELFLASEQTSWRAGALATNIAILVVSTFYQILENRYENEQRNLATIRDQQEAQLQFLRAQINPHFLFNTLNNIYSLAVARSDKTPEMVLRLSNLLRYVVYDGRAAQVELAREVGQIREYIELFQMRSEFPLDITFEQQGGIEAVKVEPMILIPLVENCFKHCDFDTNEEAFVRISLAVKDDWLFFHTINSRDEGQYQKDKVGGVGLDNIRRRLRLKHDGRHRLETDQSPGRFEVHLELPLNLPEIVKNAT
ncbi:MAG: histidine kinase [Phaeodactylibacter sp.]|nr:histidine kinase [Phaeodactylibacter sp.]